MNVTLQSLFKIIILIYFCSYDATIAELLVPNQLVNTDFPETLFTNQYCSFNPDWFKSFDGYTMTLAGMLHFALFA